MIRLLVLALVALAALYVAAWAAFGRREYQPPAQVPRDDDEPAFA